MGLRDEKRERERREMKMRYGEMDGMNFSELLTNYGRDIGHKYWDCTQHTPQ